MFWEKSNKDAKKQDIIDVEIEEDEVFDEEDEEKEDKKEERKQERYSARKEKREGKSDWEEFKEGMDKFGKQMGDFANAVKEGFVGGYNSSVKWNRERKTNETTRKILKILPFMDEEDIHEMVDKIIDDDPDFEDVEVAAIMPFLEDEDCDKLFFNVLMKKEEIDASLAAFVSEECLSHLVDEYIAGKYPNLDIDSLYPHLDGDDVKKLFYYELRRMKKSKA